MVMAVAHENVQVHGESGSEVVIRFGVSGWNTGYMRPLKY